MKDNISVWEWVFILPDKYYGIKINYLWSQVKRRYKRRLMNLNIQKLQSSLNQASTLKSFLEQSDSHFYCVRKSLVNEEIWLILSLLS